MTTSSTKRTGANRHLPGAFALTATASAAALMFLAAGAAMAQTAPATGVTDTVTVTGIRRGIESAISVKRNADGVVEAISAEDIGKLPDTTTFTPSLARHKQ